MTRARWPRYGSSSSSIRASVAARLAGERPGDEVRQVEVADAHRVDVAERPDRDLGRGPRPDPGDARSAGRRRRASGRSTIASNQAARAATRRIRSARRRSTPNGWIGVVGEARRASAGAGGSREAELGRAGRRLAVRPTRPDHARRASSPMTFCSRMAGTSDSSTAPRARDPHAREPARQLGDRADAPAGERGRSVGRARRSAGTPRAPGPRPGPRPRPGARRRRADERDRRRAVRRAGRAPGPAGDEPDRRVARPAAERRQRPARSSGPSSGYVRAGICNDPDTRRDLVANTRRNPAIRPFDAMVAADVRRPRVVASVALIALLATVAVPGPVGSRVPSPIPTAGPESLPTRRDRGACPRDGDDDPAPRSGGPFRPGTWIRARRCSSRPSEPSHPRLRFDAAQTSADGRARSTRTRGARTATCPGTGPGFYGKRTACGLAMTQTPRRRRPPHAAVRHAGHLPEPGQRPDADAAGRRSWPYVSGRDLGPDRRRLPDARALLHGRITVEVGRADASDAQLRHARCADSRSPTRCGSSSSAPAASAAPSSRSRRAATSSSASSSPTTTRRAPSGPSRRLGGDDRFVAARVDASSADDVAALCREHGITHVLNAVDPRFVMPIFEGAFAAGADYLDMAMSLSHPHPERAVRADRREARRRAVRPAPTPGRPPAGWRSSASASSPGCRTSSPATPPDHLFSEIDEIGIRDGANLVVEGYDFAPSFSIWTTIEECLNPPVIWERDRGWYTTPPFSEPETVRLPRGDRAGRVRQRRARGGPAHPALGQRPGG